MQCPFCADYDRNVLPTVIDTYVRPGKLRLEFMPLTFIGPDSVTAARFAVAMGQQDKLWNFVDVMYHDQETENSGYVTKDYLRGLAGQIPGADADRAFEDAASARVTAVLEGAKRRAQEAHVSSTPSFLIGPTGGQLTQLSVSQLDPDSFSAAIDSAIGG
jgi:protein-disulfide isomerase